MGKQLELMASVYMDEESAKTILDGRPSAGEDHGDSPE